MPATKGLHTEWPSTEPRQGRLCRLLRFLKVCVHCKCDKSEHELPPNQAGSVYERLGIKPPANMPISSSRDDAPGSVSHGYSWVPPGLTRKKLSTEFFFY
nr:CBN-LIM-9 protein [Haemonchus contortus]